MDFRSSFILECTDVFFFIANFNKHKNKTRYSLIVSKKNNVIYLLKMICQEKGPIMKR